MQTKKISMDIPMDMYEWLEKHKNINRTAVFKQEIKKLMYGVEKRVPPVLILLTIWANVGAVALLGVAIIESPIPRVIRGAMAIMAGILSLSAITVYVKTKKEISG